MTKENKELDQEIEKARKLLEAKEKETQMACSQEINAVLQKYGYELRVTEPKIVLTKKQ